MDKTLNGRRKTYWDTSRLGTFFFFTEENCYADDSHKISESSSFPSNKVFIAIRLRNETSLNMCRMHQFSIVWKIHWNFCKIQKKRTELFTKFSTPSVFLVASLWFQIWLIRFQPKSKAFKIAHCSPAA